MENFCNEGRGQSVPVKARCWTGARKTGRAALVRVAILGVTRAAAIVMDLMELKLWVMN